MEPPEQQEEVKKKSTYWDVPLTSFVRQAKGHAFYQLSGVAVPAAESKPAKPKKSEGGDGQQKTPKKSTKKKSAPQDEETSSDNAGEPTDAGYMSIKKNIIVGRPKKTVTADNVPICTCSYQPGMEKGGGCGADCINRMVMIECNPKYCPLGQYCTNQRFQKREYPKLHRFKTENKGFGIMIDEDVPAGTFIIEYVGEVISNEECNYRLERANTQKNFYFLTMDAAECIDATRKGNLARFINHSCNPNCQTQKWLVNSEIRVGIFAQKNLKKGTELTFDYQFERLGAKKQVCYCGETSCRGYLGAKKQKAEDTKSRKAKSSSKKKPASKKSATPKKPKATKPEYANGTDDEEDGTGDEEEEDEVDSEQDEESSASERKPHPSSKGKKRPQTQNQAKKGKAPPSAFDFLAVLKSIQEALRETSITATSSSSSVNSSRPRPAVFLRRNLRRSIRYHKKLIQALMEQNAQARPRLETPKVPLEKLIRRSMKEMGMLSPPPNERRKQRKDDLEHSGRVGEIGSGTISFEAVAALAAPSVVADSQNSLASPTNSGPPAPASAVELETTTPSPMEVVEQPPAPPSEGGAAPQT